MATVVPHPYLPKDLHLPNYVPPTFGRPEVLSVFFPIVALILAWCINYTRSSSNHGLSTTTEKLMFSWFVACGFIHFFIEGSFVLYLDFHADKGDKGFYWSFMASLWKEYANADSRYAWGDAFIVTMEAFTAFVEGPACWAIAYGMATTKAWRYPLMMLTSFGQFYGCLLYFLTSYYTELRDIRPEPLFFYFYFLIINLFWIVVPVAVCTHAWVKMSSAVARVEEPIKAQEKKLK